MARQEWKPPDYAVEWKPPDYAQPEWTPPDYGKEEEKGIFGKLMEVADTALWNYPSELGRKASQALAPHEETIGRAIMMHPGLRAMRPLLGENADAMAGGFARGTLEGTGDTISAMTNPVDLTAMALFGGAGLAARQNFRTARNVLNTAGRLASAPVTARGAWNAVDPESTWTERFLGLAEAAGGGVGMLQRPVPFRSERLAAKKAKEAYERIAKVQETLPPPTNVLIRPDLPTPTGLEYQGPLTPETSPLSPREVQYGLQPPPPVPPPAPPTYGLSGAGTNRTVWDATIPENIAGRTRYESPEVPRQRGTNETVWDAILPDLTGRTRYRNPDARRVIAAETPEVLPEGTLYVDNPTPDRVSDMIRQGYDIDVITPDGRVRMRKADDRTPETPRQGSVRLPPSRVPADVHNRLIELLNKKMSRTEQKEYGNLIFKYRINADEIPQYKSSSPIEIPKDVFLPRVRKIREYQEILTKRKLRRKEIEEYDKLVGELTQSERELLREQGGTLPPVRGPVLSAFDDVGNEPQFSRDPNNLFRGSEGKGLGKKPFEEQWADATREAEILGINWREYDNLDELQWDITRKTAQETIRTGRNPLADGGNEPQFSRAPKRNRVYEDLTPDVYKRYHVYDQNDKLIDKTYDRNEAHKWADENDGYVTDLGPERGNEPQFSRQSDFNEFAQDRLTEGNTSEMRVPGTDNIAMGGADPRVLDVLGTALYTRDRPSTVVKELIQNSIDERKISASTGPIRVLFNYNNIRPDTGLPARSVIVKDFGRGMTGDELYTIFSDVGKTGKSNVTDASGGFGFAKAAPFLSGDYMRATSVVMENGQKVRYTFEGTPTQFKAQDVGVPVKKEILNDSTPTGLEIETFFPSDKSLHEAQNLLRETVENSQGISNIEYSANYGNFDPVSKKGGGDETQADFLNKGQVPTWNTQGAVQKLSSQPLPTKQDIFSNPAVDADMHFDLDNIERRFSKVVVLNNGLYALDFPHSHGFNAFPHIPAKIVVNIKSKVPEGDPGYPFGANREDLDRTLKAELTGWIRDNITTNARTARDTEMTQLFNNMQPKYGNQFVVIDSGGKYTADELRRIETSPTLRKVSQVMKRELDKLGQLFTGEGLGDTIKFGFHIADEGKGGVNISRPGVASGQRSEYAILINPMGILSKYPDPQQAADRLTHIIVHEFTHNLARSEGAEFTWELAEVYSRFGLREQLRFSDEFLNIIGKGGFNPEIQGLLREYRSARGRPETTPDILARARESEVTGRPRQEDVPGSDRTDGERIPRTSPITGDPVDSSISAAVSGGGTRPPDRVVGNARMGEPERRGVVRKLLGSVDEVRPLREEQERLHSTERARRFREFTKKVKKAQGRYGVLSTMKELEGPLPKVEWNPFESQFTTDEIDTLFDIVASSNQATNFERPHAIVGLSKLFGSHPSGMIPQRNEIRVLARIFNEFDPSFGQAFEKSLMKADPNFSPAHKALGDIAGFRKAVMSSFDLSAPLRQGLGFVTRKEWYTAWPQMFRSLFSQKAHDTFMANLRADPMYSLAQHGNLAVGGIEEAFPSQFATRLWGIKQSSRAYGAFLEKLRFDVFKDIVHRTEVIDARTMRAMELTSNTRMKAELKNQLINAKQNDVFLRELSNFINTSSGRGSLGQFEAAAGVLNNMFFSPKLLASRLQMFNPKYYMGLSANPRHGFVFDYTDMQPGMNMIRKEKLRSLFGVIGFGNAVAGLSYLAGAEVSTDSNSADFGKVKVGNLRLDPYGGFQQFVVLGSRVWTNKRASSVRHPMDPNYEIELGSRYGYPSKLDVIGAFLMNKTAPEFGLMVRALSQRTAQGAPFTRDDLWDENIQRSIPIFAQDIWELAQEDPYLLPFALPAGFGMGVNVYGDERYNPLNSPGESSGFDRTFSNILSF